MVSRLAWAALLALHLAAALPGQQMEEYQLKAAFLYNFAKFVDWPSDAFSGPDEPFSLCVLGLDPFGRALDDVIAGKVIGGRPIAVRRISDVHKAAGCQVLFLSASEHKRDLAVLAATKASGVLTVGEAGSSTAGGAVINFILEAGKVRFEINLASAEEQKLRLSSKLLSLATTVRH